jgi:hypothetical protein
MQVSNEFKPIPFNAKDVRNNDRFIKTPYTVFTIISAVNKIQGDNTQNNSLVSMKIFSGALSVQSGTLQLITSLSDKASTKPQKIEKAANLTISLSKMGSGLAKVVANALSLSSSFVVTAVKTNLLAVSKILGKVSNSFILFYLTINLVQTAIKKDSLRNLIKELNGLEDFKTFDFERIKSLAPKALAKNQTCKLDNQKLKQEIIKELQATILKSDISLVTCILSLITTIIGFAVSLNIGLIISAIIGAASSVISAVSDINTGIKSLKKAEGMSKVELILKINMIAFSFISLVLSVIFAPTIPLAILAGLVGVLVMSVPVTSIVLLKIKEGILKQEAKLKERQIEQAHIKKVEAENAFHQHLAELENRINPKIKEKKEYFSVFNDNYEVNLKLIAAVNGAFNGSIFDKDQMYRFNSKKAMAAYSTTVGIFLEGIKGKVGKVAILNLKEGEKVDAELIDAISKVCDLQINGILYTKAILRKVT